MIFVSVGTHNQQFNRLLEEIDNLIINGKLKEKVIAQIGHSTYKPKNYEHFRFASWNRILYLNKNADLIVTHGGAGNLIVASHFGKTIIAVPRVRSFGEHVNDHQLQLVSELEKEGRVIPVYDIRNLGAAIDKAKKHKLRRKGREEKRIISIVEDYIERVARQEH